MLVGFELSFCFSLIYSVLKYTHLSDLTLLVG